MPQNMRICNLLVSSHTQSEPVDKGSGQILGLLVSLNSSEKGGELSPVTPQYKLMDYPDFTVSNCMRNSIGLKRLI